MFRETHTVRLTLISKEPLTKEEQIKEILKMEIAYNSAANYRIHIEDVER